MKLAGVSRLIRFSDNPGNKRVAVQMNRHRSFFYLLSGFVSSGLPFMLSRICLRRASISGGQTRFRDSETRGSVFRDVDGGNHNPKTEAEVEVVREVPDPASTASVPTIIVEGTAAHNTGLPF